MFKIDKLVVELSISEFNNDKVELLVILDTSELSDEVENLPKFAYL